MSNLASSSLAFLDVETTGLSPWFGDRICEIAILRCRGNELLDTFETLVNPERPISPGAARVNGLTELDLADAPLFAEIAVQVKLWLEDAIIVCHNAPFDLGFVSSEFNRLGQKLPPVEVIDTLLLARAYFDFDSNSLQAIADHLMIDRSAAHRAMADVLTTRDVLEHFLVKLKRLPIDRSSRRPLPVKNASSSATLTSKAVRPSVGSLPNKSWPWTITFTYQPTAIYARRIVISGWIGS
jgi:DNA polymerase-3 subunit epsilon